MKPIVMTLKVFIILSVLSIIFLQGMLYDSPKVFSFSGGIPSVYGQLGYEHSPYLDYVAINNDIVSIDDNGIVETKIGDVLKVSGRALPLSTAYVYFNDITYDATVDEYGNWFVVFSVLNTSSKALPINVELTTPDSQKFNATFFSTVITDYMEEVGINEIEERKSNIFWQKAKIWVGILALCLLSGTIGWLIGLKGRDVRKLKMKDTSNRHNIIK